jgi:hypothetical protein
MEIAISGIFSQRTRMELSFPQFGRSTKISRFVHGVDDKRFIFHRGVVLLDVFLNNHKAEDM